MHEEWHVTVEEYMPASWYTWCHDHGLKPLLIELNNFERQLMLAAPYDCSKEVINGGWTIARVKHEVQPEALDVTTHGDKEKVWHRSPVNNAIYYECHIKLDGQFRPEFRMASRDLYRRYRWYITHRQTAPFTPEKFVEIVMRKIADRNHLDSFEYEAALIDTNPGLDARWN